MKICTWSRLKRKIKEMLAKQWRWRHQQCLASCSAVEKAHHIGAWPQAMSRMGAHRRTPGHRYSSRAQVYGRQPQQAANPFLLSSCARLFNYSIWYFLVFSVKLYLFIPLKKHYTYSYTYKTGRTQLRSNHFLNDATIRMYHRNVQLLCSLVVKSYPLVSSTPNVWRS